MIQSTNELCVQWCKNNVLLFGQMCDHLVSDYGGGVQSEYISTFIQDMTERFESIGKGGNFCPKDPAEMDASFGRVSQQLRYVDKKAFDQCDDARREFCQQMICTMARYICQQRNCKHHHDRPCRKHIAAVRDWIECEYASF